MTSLTTEETNEWWNDKQFLTELDNRYEALESGEDKGVTIEQLKAIIANRRNTKDNKP